ncbi:MAG: histidine phosphatase family protein [Myxococcales bacterium]|nr:histidine phosphatase family protein [Myxococcales bacterium]MCB9530497.1 histidine phosphatase family protein [Myxococcales bacterium]MCB9533449.1 histidine phosphatase family protein [Myxococcales bacterium]
MTFVRHAETTANASRTIAGWHDVPLTPRGEDQARALRPLLEGRSFDSIWSSDLQRAVHTARLAGFEPALEPRVRELDFGELDGRVWDDIAAQYAEHFATFGTFQAPGGESVETLRRRVLAFVDDLEVGDHLVFSHGGVLRTVLAELGERRFVANCTILVVNWTRRAVVEELRPEGVPPRTQL